MERKKKYYIENYGCQMNISDSEIVCSILDNEGFIQTDLIQNDYFNKYLFNQRKI